MSKYSTKQLIRFWSKVKIADTNECWEWQASKNKDGYGQVTINYKVYRAHRVSWELFNGEMPPDMEVMHKCDNPCCVNPKHLILGTHQENMTDHMNKGRHRSVTGTKHWKCKLTTDQVKYIRSRWESGGITKSQLGREVGVSHVQIIRIINGKSRRKE